MEGNLEVPFPVDPSIRYGVVFALIHRAQEEQSMVNSFRWLAKESSPEWVSLFVKRVLPRIEALGLKGKFVKAMSAEPKLMGFAKQYRAYMQDAWISERKAG
jgi:hypothetical protein